MFLHFLHSLVSDLSKFLNIKYTTFDSNWVGVALNNIYKVTINGWEDHNEKHKKGYDYFKFKNNFFADPSIAQLSQNQVLMYVNLLCIASEMSTNSYTIHVKILPKLLRMGDKMLQNALDQLQSLQLLTYEIVASPYISKDKIIKEKLIKDNLHEIEKPQKAVKEKTPELNKKIWEAYEESYIARYKESPVRNAMVNRQIAQIAERLGSEAVDVVNFYLTHNDTFYVRNAHSIGLCLKNAESLRTQWARGIQITQSKLRSFEKAVDQQELLNAIEKGKV